MPGFVPLRASGRGWRRRRFDCRRDSRGNCVGRFDARAATTAKPVGAALLAGFDRGILPAAVTGGDARGNSWHGRSRRLFRLAALAAARTFLGVFVEASTFRNRTGFPAHCCAGSPCGPGPFLAGPSVPFDTLPPPDAPPFGASGAPDLGVFQSLILRAPREPKRTQA